MRSFSKYKVSFVDFGADNHWNYYLNVTIFPFLEVAYTCTLFTAESLGLDKHGYSGFTNQDRYFSARLRNLYL